VVQIQRRVDIHAPVAPPVFRMLRVDDQPLVFENLMTVTSHGEHLEVIKYLQQGNLPAVVLAGSGMCSGGRIVNYLKAMLGDARHDVLFCGYQAAGTPGRTIQTYGPRGGWVELDGQRITIRAGVHTLGGYSAHADQRDLLEDTMYRRLFTLWDEFADAQVVFDDHGSDNHFCAQKV
jgi:predicted metal-dependent RNase